MNRFLTAIVAAGVHACAATTAYQAGSDLTQWDPLFKDDYAPAIVDQLQSENNILKFMESEAPDDTWVGRKKIIPIKIGRNYSSGSIGVGNRLPQEGR
jgi:hypothetical protein